MTLVVNEQSRYSKKCTFGFVRKNKAAGAWYSAFTLSQTFAYYFPNTLYSLSNYAYLLS